jgi:two-component system, OmpR family, alkaline phosphatase synthesis response regulator PhoP
MPNIFLVAKEIGIGKKLYSLLSNQGFTVALSTGKDKMVERVIREIPQLIMVEMNGYASQEILHGLTFKSGIQSHIPIIALVTSENLDRPEDYLGVDDFIVWPCDDKEIIFRVKRLLQRNSLTEETIRCGNLVIDLANCEVRVGGKVVELTFKEYELLKFLAKNRGRVFSREALLNKVWGYDYFGGDRTVDVHITRLRSKIEESGLVFIETVRNIGYRFTKDVC